METPRMAKKASLTAGNAVSGGGLFGSSGPAEATVTKSLFEIKSSATGTEYTVFNLGFEDGDGNGYEQQYAVFTSGRDKDGNNVRALPTSDGNGLEFDTEDEDAAVGLQKSCDYVKFI